MPEPRIQLHQPRVAELVADVLRQRILNDELDDDSSLPNQELLLEEFTISKPSLREALRILETEGLITVRRGSIGGAHIHKPKARDVAYSLALVLQARQVAIDDVGTALKRLEGLCAGLCAHRPDRMTAVVPQLRKTNDDARTTIEDPLAYVAATAQFHRRLVDSCGNETMRLMAGSLEAVWLSHVQRWAESQSETGTFPDQGYREEGLETHEQITQLIVNGDATGVRALAEEHFDPEQFYTAADERTHPVQASVIRGLVQ